MLKGLKNYVKCVYVNKITLAGLVLVTAGTTSMIQNPSENLILGFCLLGVGGFLGGITVFGLETYMAYKRTRKNLEKYGDVPKSFKSKYENSYCTNKGCNLAIKESKLEKGLG